MRDWKKAFGSPDGEFEARVRRTLLQIQEKEEAQVKKKMTLSMALAMALCLTILTVSALALGGKLPGGRPDVTNSLSQGKEENASMPNPDPTDGEEPAPTLLPTLPDKGTPPPDATLDPWAMAMPTPTPALPGATLDPRATPMPMPSPMPTPGVERVFYVLSGGEADEIYYHLRPHGDYEDCQEVTLEEAREMGRVFCCPDPECFGPEDAEMAALRELVMTGVAAGLMNESALLTKPIYYHTQYGMCYHWMPYCQGMEGAVPVSQADAEEMGQSPCPLCGVTAYEASGLHYCLMDWDDVYYHVNPHTPEGGEWSDGESVTWVDRDALLGGGYRACPLCFPREQYSGAQATSPTVRLMLEHPIEDPDGRVRFWSLTGQTDEWGWMKDGVSLDMANDTQAFTLLSMSMAQARGGIYGEFEFEVDVSLVDPDSVRVDFYSESWGSLSWSYAEVKPCWYQGEEEGAPTGYLLCQLMPTPEEDFPLTEMRVWGRTWDGKTEIIAVFR